MTSATSAAPPERRFLPRLNETCETIIRELTPTAAYAIRASLACGLALWIAAFWQLRSPLSAVTTVLIVANPVSGALLSKSVWRILGTIIGASLGIILMSAFPQQPMLYFAALAIAIGIACCVATLLRFFKAYAAVLSGYTIIMISAGAFADPDGIFMSAVDRLSVVTTGIISTAIVFMITTGGRSHLVLLRVHTLLRDVLSHFVTLIPEEEDNRPREDEEGQDGAFRGMDTELYTTRSRLLAQTETLIQAVEFAAADNVDIRHRAASLRVGISRLLGMLSAHHPAWRDMNGNDRDQVRQARQLSASVMEDISSIPADALLRGDNGKISSRIAEAQWKLNRLADEATDSVSLAAIDSERDIIMELGEAWACLSGEDPARNIRLQPFLEWPAALRNGARGTTVTLLACLIWYTFHWSNAPQMMLFLLPGSCLLATAPSATRASGMLASGVAFAIPANLAFHTFVLPRIDGYPMLCASLILFLLPGIWIQFHPKYSLRGFGYAVFFNAMTSVGNPVVANDLSLLNGYLAFLIAAILLTLVFKVVLPVDQRLDCARIISSLTKSVQNLARASSGTVTAWTGWEHLQMQKVLRLTQRLSFFAPAARIFEVTDAAFAAVSLGRVIMRLQALRHTLPKDTPELIPLSRVFDSFRFLHTDPLKTAAVCQDEARAVLDTENMISTPAHARRMAACMIQAAHLIDAAPGFFHKGGPMQYPADHPGSDHSLRSLPAGMTRQIVTEPL
ncbi:FUSC family protein [Acetobacter sp. AN02]|uniref:FUSC family protein n=1 Tax=Acetobacter sp. AN02 TaxID=2894186 RepID=UPI0024342120|nr:FUSC family protein [Acetobacter sp. AN02]MDG6093667.1 FUSC family protein [Acetobacter sp. AN02]